MYDPVLAQLFFVVILGLVTGEIGEWIKADRVAL
jgi:hypothetical protein